MATVTPQFDIELGTPEYIADDPIFGTHIIKVPVIAKGLTASHIALTSGVSSLQANLPGYRVDKMIPYGLELGDTWMKLTDTDRDVHLAMIPTGGYNDLATFTAAKPSTPQDNPRTGAAGNSTPYTNKVYMDTNVYDHLLLEDQQGTGYIYAYLDVSAYYGPKWVLNARSYVSTGTSRKGPKSTGIPAPETDGTDGRYKLFTYVFKLADNAYRGLGYDFALHSNHNIEWDTSPELYSTWHKATNYARQTYFHITFPIDEFNFGNTANISIDYAYQYHPNPGSNQHGTHPLATHGFNHSDSTLRSIIPDPSLPADVEGPVITVVGSNPEQIVPGASFIDDGATAFDILDDQVRPVVATGIDNIIIYPNNTLVVTMIDSYGDSWNGAVMTITDPNGLVFSSPGPAASLLTENFNITVPGTYTWETTGGSYPSEISYNVVTGNGGETLLDAAGAGSGTFVVPATALVTGQGALSGVHTITYTSSDSTGNVSVATRTVEVGSMSASITLTGDSTHSHPWGVVWADPGYTATDSSTGDITSQVTISGTVDINTDDSYTLTYSVVGSDGQTRSALRTVVISDTTAPVVTVTGANPEFVSVGAVYTDSGATATDDKDGALAVVKSGVVGTDGLLSSGLVSRYTLDSDVSDSIGSNDGTITGNPVYQTIDNRDVLTFDGSDYIELPSTLGSVVSGDYTMSAWINPTSNNHYPGVILIDGQGLVLRSVAASSQLGYLPDGNTATQYTSASEALPYNTWSHVLLTKTGTSFSLYINGVLLTGTTGNEVGWGLTGISAIGRGYSTYHFKGPIDDVRIYNRVLTAQEITTIHSRNGQAPPGSGAAEGTYTITYTATDAAGNIGTATRTVEVQTSSASITLTGDSSIDHEFGTTWTDPGYTATDSSTGDITSQVAVTGTVNTSTDGTYTLTYSVAGSDGTTVSATRTVIVADTTLPVVTVTGAASIALQPGDSYTDAGATATDNKDGAIAVVTTGVDAISVAADANWNDVKLLLPLDGDSVDSSTSGHTITASGAVSYDTSDKVWGSASISVPGSSYLNIPAHGDFNFGTDDFTFEFYHKGSQTNQGLVFEMGHYSTGMMFGYWDAGNNTHYNMYIGGTAFEFEVAGIGAWKHLAIVKSSGTGTVYVDGVAQMSKAAGSVNLSGGTFRLGQGVHRTDLLFTGKFDDVRITKGVARYTSNFTVPADAHPTAATGGAAVGSHTITYTATDAANNVGTATRTVTVADTIPPVLTVLGNDPESTSTNAAYADAGATAVDAVDGAVAVVTTGLDSIGIAATETFAYTGADQSFVIPAGITSITACLWGAGGAGGYPVNGAGGPGAAGGYTEGTIAVTPGETITLVVGGAGNITSGANTHTPVVYGFGGRGYVGSHNGAGGAGGGLAGLFRGSADQSNALIIAGGGAGGGGYFTSNNIAGAAGGLLGLDGGDPESGTGGTQTAGGTAASVQYAGQAGSALQGGNGGHICGGGGAGYFGGAGGGHVGGSGRTASGGGGSSFLGTTTDSSTQAGSGVTPPYQSSDKYVAGVGVGGAANTVGGPALIVVSYSSGSTAGTHTVTYTATDAASNVATATRTVTVIPDTTAPVVTVTGENPVNLAAGATYTDAGATAVDNIDGAVAVVTTGVAAIGIPTTDALAYTGAEQTYIVPAGITSITAKLWGAGGGSTASSAGTGGAGGYTEGTIAVTPGATLKIVTGAGGAAGTAGAAGAAGYGGGGAGGPRGGRQGAAGGGYSGIFLNTVSHANALLIAGGGGGSGFQHGPTPAGNGGAGGGTTGSDAPNVGNYPSNWGGFGATGGSQSSGGAIGKAWFHNGGDQGYRNATVGSALQGGNGGDRGDDVGAGGGGGGGYYGGGGGAGSQPGIGGGGGSSFIIGIATNSQTIAGTTFTPPQQSDADYVAGIGLGAALTNSGGNGLVTITHSGGGAIAGTHTVTYTATDASNNVGTATRTVNIVPPQSASITLTGGATINHEWGTTWTDPGFTASDFYTGDLTSQVTVSGTVDINTGGSYVLTYNVVGSDGQTFSITRTVTVVDTTAPVITLTGAASITVEAGTSYTDAGATATDNKDGDLTSSIQTAIVKGMSGAVYTEDLSGGSAGWTDNTVVSYTATRTDTSTAISGYMHGRFGGTSNNEKTITISGATGQTINVKGKYFILDSWDTEPGKIYVNGVEMIGFTAGGGGSPVSFSNGSGLVTAQYPISGFNHDKGWGNENVIEFDIPYVMTSDSVVLKFYAGLSSGASDESMGFSIDEISMPEVPVGSVDTNSVAVYTVRYNVDDSTGLSATQVTRTVTVADTTASVITLLGNNPEDVVIGATYTDAGATALDANDGAVAVVTTGGPTQGQNLLNGISAHLPMSGDLSVIGSSGVTSVSGHQTVNTTYYKMGDRSLSFTGGQLTTIGNVGTTPDQGTISFWIKPSSTAGIGNPMSTNGQSGNNAIRFEFNWQSKNKLGVYVGNGSTYSGASFGDDNSMSAGNWYLITFTWDKTEGASGTARAYKDGVLESTHSTINDFLPSNLNNVVLGGGFSSAGERYYNGLMNGFVIHSRVLSLEDITYMYNAGAGRSQFTDAAGAQEGTYTVTYTATDAASNVATATRTVNVMPPFVKPEQGVNHYNYISDPLVVGLGAPTGAGGLAQSDDGEAGVYIDLDEFLHETTGVTVWTRSTGGVWSTWDATPEKGFTFPWGTSEQSIYFQLGSASSKLVRVIKIQEAILYDADKTDDDDKSQSLKRRGQASVTLDPTIGEPIVEFATTNWSSTEVKTFKTPKAYTPVIQVWTYEGSVATLASPGDFEIDVADPEQASITRLVGSGNVKVRVMD